MESREGKQVPDVTFKMRIDGKWCDVTTDDIFKGKSIAVFALPGAFTPTCSSSHVPRFDQLAETFKANGVDEVICMAVNDTFVMEAWCVELDAPNIRFIPDGCGHFAEGMGMLVDKCDIGFGKRSWRYSMLVRDKTIVKQFIEPQVPGDPFQVSDADTLLDFINPKAEKPQFVTVFARDGCPHCAAAKKTLTERGMRFEVVKTGLGTGITSRTLQAVSGKSTVPQIFIGGKLIGGNDDLQKYFE